MKFLASDIKQLLPEWYGTKNLEMNTILETEAHLLEEGAELSQRVQDSSLILHCDEESISMYEDMFRIAPNPSDSLELRRERLLIKLRLRRPFTLDYMIQQANALVGVGNYTITTDVRNYGFMIDYAENFDRKWIPEFNKLVLVTLPANLVYTIRLNYSDTLTLSEESLMDTQNVKYFRISDVDPAPALSGIGDPLEEYYNQRQEEIDVTLSNQALVNTAGFLRDTITRVQVNEVADAEFVSKTVSGTSAFIEFNIPESINTLKRMDMYNSNGELLSTIFTNVNTVNDTRINYKIEVKRG